MRGILFHSRDIIDVECFSPMMNDHVTVIGVPTDFGTNRRGVDMGPSAIRYAGLIEELSTLGLDVTDAGDIPRPEKLTENGKYENELAQVNHVSTALADEVHAQRSGDRLPLVLGGDHSIGLGSLHGINTELDIGLLWFDAHADCNTPETSPSGNIHGMVLAAALGIGSFTGDGWPSVPGLSPENIALLGTRSVDDGERDILAESEISVESMSAIDRDGITAVFDRALERVLDGTDGVFVSLDMDFIDPIEAPGVGTPVRGGVTYREAHLVMEFIDEHLRDEGLLFGLEVVEVNPIRDRQNQTADLATELIASACGKTIY